jgi:glycosyltransferase involved in cell wall biosynthesis
VTPLRVIHLVEALGVGGLERIVQSLVRHAGPIGVAAEVVCAVRGGRVAAEIESEGSRVHVVGATGYRPHDVLLTARLLGRLKPDVVHTHGHFAGVLGRAAAWWVRVPVRIHHLHTIDTTLRDRHLLMERWLARLTHRILCCSRAVASHATTDLGIDESLLSVVPNGIEPPPAADRQGALAALGRPDSPLVGCVGSLTPHKGQAVLLKALGQIEDSRPWAVLVGDGPERADLERLASRREGPRALFLGERPDARRLLPAFDVMAVPSVSREGFGLAALEGMDAGLPVIASRVGGLPEVLEDGRSGLLVPPGDPQSLAAALTRLFGRPEERRALGVEGRLRVERHFRASLMAERVGAIYEEAFRARAAA